MTWRTGLFRIPESLTSFARFFLLLPFGCSWHSGTVSIKAWKGPLNKLGKVSNSDIHLCRKHRGNSFRLRKTVDFRLPYLNKMELHYWTKDIWAPACAVWKNRLIECSCWMTLFWGCEVGSSTKSVSSHLTVIQQRQTLCTRLHA